MTAAFNIEAAGRTHVGHVRRRNEDAFYQGHWLYVVADGLGGHVAGDIASSTAVEAMKAYDRRVEPADLGDVLGRAVSDADDALRRKIRTEPGLAGMGTTVVSLMRSENAAVLANIGDSRAYLVRNHQAGPSQMVPLTEDHTYRHLVADASEVPNLPEKLTRFLDGRKDGRSPDLTPVPLQPGDRVLLCSDGLSSYVPDRFVQHILKSPRSATAIADDLVEAALRHGGPDNVTVMVLHVRD